MKTPNPSRKVRKTRKVAVPCRVFLLCRNAANTTIPHPILGDVPACARCAAKIAAIEALSVRP